MIRTLIFGAIAGYVGKKLYDEGKLTEFKDDLVARYNEAKAELDKRRDSDAATPSPNLSSSHTPTAATSPLIS
ncbi:hypothetical protein [Sphingobium sp. EM0848]|uniref:hypothetical protein n=1 Tax=Sphingobium sp. EM0848 TaxID=2743473 RepID=UPI00159C6C81|nr:hypothetical protein [Sphingobium sp. EM0848]